MTEPDIFTPGFRENYDKGSLKRTSMDRIEHLEVEKNAPKTGYPELDNLVVGFLPGHVYLLAGITNAGKTSMACNFVHRLAKAGHSSLYLALEPDFTIINYLAALEKNKPFKQLTAEDLEMDNELMRVLRREDGLNNFEDLVGAIKGQADPAKVVVIDHIGYFITGERDTLQEQQNVIRELAILAKEMKEAIIIITHLRKPTGKRANDIPVMFDIYGSGNVVYDATDVLLLVRHTDPEDKYQVKLLSSGEIIVGKAKVGRSGAVSLTFFDSNPKILSESDLMRDETLAKPLFLRDEDD